MIDFASPHIVYVAASYLVAFVLLVALVGWTVSAYFKRPKN